MSRRLFVNLVSLLVALVMGAAAFAVFYRQLSQPRSFADSPWAALMDWCVDICAAVTTALITFFVVWGHFQKVEPPRENQAAPSEDLLAK